MAYKAHTPYNVPFRILIPTISVTKGTRAKAYTEEATTRFCSFRTFGGTENLDNGIYSVIDTATLETWYDPAITSDTRLRIYATDGSLNGEDWEIIARPENIEMRNQYLVCKVRKVTGGA